MARSIKDNKPDQLFLEHQVETRKFYRLPDTRGKICPLSKRLFDIDIDCEACVDIILRRLVSQGLRCLPSQHIQPKASKDHFR